MQSIIESIKDLYVERYGKPCDQVDVLPQSGSDRRYFRIHDGQRTCIATYGNNIPENETFIYFSRHFQEAGLPVPEIYALTEDKTIYLQQDFGDTSLLNRLEAEGLNENVYKLFESSL
jgi:aminoglycoside/choline kinase family phosphotransferase